MRDYLAANNGIRGLEVLTPHEVERATRLFYRDGFVVVREVLTSQQLAFLRAGVEREANAMLALDPDRRGNRGRRRYSFGAASLTGALLHQPEWALLLDLPTVTPLVASIFDSMNYHARSGGGDFCLPGADTYQPLHSDMADRVTFPDPATGQPSTYFTFHDPRRLLTHRDLPCPYLACNFLSQDFTALNGPTRQIPGTQHSRERIPTLAEEPEWMKLSTVCPAPAGSVLIRDVRAWHGGTPNLSKELRAIPNVEFHAPWYLDPQPKSVPREVYATLSKHARHLCRYIVADVGEELATGYKKELGGTPDVLLAT